MPLAVDDLRGILYAACRKATADETTLLDILGAMLDGAYEPALDGAGILDIISSSNAGQSTTQGSPAGAPTQSQIGKAATLLYRLALGCPAQPPTMEGNLALCSCVDAKLPLRGVRRVRSSYLAMLPDV